MFKKPNEITETQEIKQEERELRREYFIFLPILLFIVAIIALNYTNSETKTVVELVPTQGNSGYWIVYDNGEVTNFGTATPVESVQLADDAKIVAAQAAEEGLWLLSNKGGINALAGAMFSGEIDPIIPIEGATELLANPNGRSYRILDQDGPVFPFNSAPISGGDTYNKSVASAASTKSGEGYWIFQPNGEINAFGDAAYFDNLKLTDEEVVDADRYTNGAIVLTNKGRVIVLGGGQTHGDMSSQSLESPMIDIDSLPDNSGYRITTMDGTVYSFGSAVTL